MDNVWHVYPVEDNQEHALVALELNGAPYCQCKCEPEIKNEGDSFLIIHNSFDGREGIEWANEILSAI